MSKNKNLFLEIFTLLVISIFSGCLIYIGLSPVFEWLGNQGPATKEISEQGKNYLNNNPGDLLDIIKLFTVVLSIVVAHFTGILDGFYDLIRDFFGSPRDKC